MRSWVRQFLRWLSLFVTMLFVLISCSTGDNPISVNPSQDPGGSISSEIQSISLMNAQSTFEVSYSVRSQWQDGFVADITIENFGDPIDGWTLRWIFPSDQIRITNLWNGQLTQDGANVTVADAGWNARIPSNGQVNFGFQASYRGTDVIPSAFSLNGESLSKPTPIPLPAACEVDYQIRSEWEQGFVADLTLHNLGAAVTDWELSWVFPVDGVQITNLWNGQVNQTDREVKVTNLDWNATIATDGEVDLGFQAAYGGGGVTPTEFRLNEVICNGLPATPSTTPPPEIPTNAIQILSLTDVDGSALTVGDTLTLTAVAGDAQGQDISSQIQWTNAAGEVIGTGSTLLYEADEVMAETLKASVGSLQARISFTVSTPDVIVAAHVKVLPDEAQELVESLDLDQGELRLTDSELLPTILIGDVLIGAAGEVPPVKVSSLDLEEGVWMIGVTAALPKEVIEKGSATFEQTIDWSGESGEVTIVDIPGEPFHIADQLEPKWEGFVQAGDPIQTGLKVTANSRVRYTSNYSGTIELDSKTLDGIHLFEISQNSEIAINAGINFSGYGSYLTGNTDQPVATYPAIPTKYASIKTIIGPVPLIIQLDLTNEFEIVSNIDVEGFANFEVDLDLPNYEEKLIYSAEEANPWQQALNLDQIDQEGMTDTSISDESDSFGLISLANLSAINIRFLGVSFNEIQHLITANAMAREFGISVINSNDETSASLVGISTSFFQDAFISQLSWSNSNKFTLSRMRSATLEKLPQSNSLFFESRSPEQEICFDNCIDQKGGLIMTTALGLCGIAIIKNPALAVPCLYINGGTFGLILLGCELKCADATPAPKSTPTPTPASTSKPKNVICE